MFGLHLSPRNRRPDQATQCPRLKKTMSQYRSDHTLGVHFSQEIVLESKMVSSVLIRKFGWLENDFLENPSGIKCRKSNAGLGAGKRASLALDGHFDWCRSTKSRTARKANELKAKAHKNEDAPQEMGATFERIGFSTSFNRKQAYVFRISVI